ncbi:hypothetical protein [Treponema sp. OMZ 857]|uniref:hypothetical protein n=1 Tax=Treponema sp. OMZ 857 TaxID=1643513 RepID=UPI0020A38612|nr:hypothetical protein [Treponema sp. OMZ 857]UTC44501.1 hypothetical protein E4N66_10725 [Treponema sp. OMZ 857]
MNFIEIFSSRLYNSKEIYNYFSEDEILNIPFDLYNLIDMDQKTENEFIFPNIIEFLTDLYVTLNVKDKDYKYIDSKLEEINFWEKFSEYLYSDFLYKKEVAILTFAKKRSASNCKYLEAAFISEYYKKNPILTARCLTELFYLKSKKAKEFKKLLVEDFDLINFISILLFDDEELTNKVLGLNKNEKYLQKIRADSIQNFTMNFEIFITNVQGANKIKDFTRDEYIKSINYFEKIYSSYKIDDFYSFYKKALQEMEISHNTGL